MAIVKRTTCGDTTTVVFKTKPAWYLAGEKFLIGSGAVIVSAIIGYVVTHISGWIPAQYQELVTTVLIPFLLYIRKYLLVIQEESQTIKSDSQECKDEESDI